MSNKNDKNKHEKYDDVAVLSSVLKKKKDRLHVLMALGKILLDLDKANAIIRETPKDSDVISNLTKGFGIDEMQAEFIVNSAPLEQLNREKILECISEIEGLQIDIETIEKQIGGNTTPASSVTKPTKSYSAHINQYLTLSEKISKLENELPNKQKALEKKFSYDYANLKRELQSYSAKIKPTVETVCSLYKNKINLSNNQIYYSEVANTISFNALNACDIAMKAGAESIQYLYEILKCKNIDSNLKEFALRYNTVMRVYSEIDTLCSKAVSMSMNVCRNEIDRLKSQRSSLFKNTNVFNGMLRELQIISEDMCQKVLINDHKEFETDFVTEITLPLAYEICNEKSLLNNKQKELILSLLEWKLHEDGIMVIKSDESGFDSADFTYCTTNAIIQFLFSYPASSKQILLCDSISSSAITTFAGILKNENPKLFFDNANGSFVKNSDDEIRTSISVLNKTINQRIMILGQSRYSNVLEYNHKNPDNPLPIILVLLNGYPLRYQGASDDLASAFKNGKAAGVYFIITENTHQDEESKYYRQAMPELEEITANIAVYSVAQEKGYLSKDNKKYIANTCGENYNMHSTLNAFKKEVSNKANQVVYLDNVVDKEEFARSERREKYSKVLSVPFGKQGSNPISINLNADGMGAHLAIIGTTGSGKTAFLNSFILSACSLYSPAELEFHLIVMVKQGFKMFKEERLPHLKTVVTGDKIFAANDVLDFIEGEMKRRSVLMGSYETIYAYNKVAENPLSRCIIIIDELNQLIEGNNEAVKRIQTIAETGRAFGISLIISSTGFSIEINSLTHLFGNKIEFHSEKNAGQLVPRVTNRHSELTSFRGSCFFDNGINLHHVRVAFAEEEERLRNNIRKVAKKYPSFEMELQSEIKAVRVKKEQDAPFAVNNAKKNYDEKGVIRTRLGTVYLSNRALEYPFSDTNNLLFLFGDYLVTKAMEASLIKDTLVLSKNVDAPTVYYLDYNKNASLRRAKNIVKALMPKWVQAGKMVYSSRDEFDDTLEDIKQLIQARQDDDESDLSPVLVVIAKADDIFAEDNEEDEDLLNDILDIINQGKDNNVYFTIQCSEPTRFYRCEKYLKDAIIFPDRYSDDTAYASTELCAALEAMPAGSTEQGKKLISNASKTALDPRLHILCDNNRISVFVPYEYNEEYLKNIVDIGGLL